MILHRYSPSPWSFVVFVLWAILLAMSTLAVSTFSLMGTRGRAAFALPPLIFTQRPFLFHGINGCHNGGQTQRKRHIPLSHAWPILPRLSLLALRGGTRDQKANRLCSRVAAKARGSAKDESDDFGDAERESRAKQGKSKGDLVDVDANTGAELRRRPRGRGRSLVGYTQQENGDWLRVVGDAAQKQKTLSPFLARTAAAAPEQTSNYAEDTDTYASASPLDDHVSTSATIADQIQSPIGTTGNLEDIAPLDESIWVDLPSKWVVFSDLHVSRSSLATCLEVLRVVHAEAVSRSAGVIFLGDFWHEKGVLRTECLNSILLALRQWRLPLIALPGNHDQSTLNGLVHALTPLALVMPACRVISRPTILLNALWIPYSRDAQAVRDAMAGGVGDTPPPAIFCHVDVIGADMSGGMLAERGLRVEDFPPHAAVYTGHYHKAHALWGAEGSRTRPIVYVGSQWQTSMREAEEEKRLLLLDSANDWAIAEEIPISVGRRHFRASSLAHLKANLHAWSPREGDRVQVRVEDAPAAREEAQEVELPAGVALELIERPTPQRAEARVPAADTLDPMALLHQYFALLDRGEDESGGGARENNTESERRVAADNATRVAAQAVLQTAMELTPRAAQHARSVVFESVEIRGLGSFGFEKPVRYPLRDRGVVLVMGRNEDEACADSNGAGKTTLCMAALWALTGSADVRADGKRLGRKDVVHAAGVDPQAVLRVASVAKHKNQAPSSSGAAAAGASGATGALSSSSSASVCLRGTVDDVAFEIRRRMSGGKSEAHSLRFTLGGRDLTQSTLRDTQVEVERVLPVSVLADAVFHGQHLVTGLLEKTDKDFKTALDNIIATDVWVAAQQQARERRKQARAAREQLVGRCLEKDEQQQPLEGAVAEALALSETWQQEHRQGAEAVAARLESAERAAASCGSVGSCRTELEQAQRMQAAEQRALDAQVDATADARAAAAARRQALAGAAEQARSAEKAAGLRVELAAARMQELERASSRLTAAAQQVRTLEVDGQTWAREQQQRVSEASQALNRALAECESVRRGAAEAAARSAGVRLHFVRAVNASVADMERAAAHAAASEEAASAASSRAAEFASLSAAPSCRLCMQPIDARTHAEHMQAMSEEAERQLGVLAAARVRFQETQAVRQRARGQLDGCDEDAAAEERACRQALLQAEAEWHRARMQIAATDSQQNPHTLALAAARHEHRRAQLEAESVRAAICASLREFAPQPLDLTAAPPLDAQTDAVDARGAGAREGRRVDDAGDVSQVLAAAHAWRESLKAAAVRAGEQLSEELRRQDAAMAEWERELVSARERVGSSSAQVDVCARRLDAAQQQERQVEELVQKSAAHAQQVNPWSNSLTARRSALADNAARLQQLRQQLRQADVDAALWARVDELLGKRGLQSFVYEVAVVELQRRAAKYLTILSDDSLRLELAIDTQVVERRLLVRLTDGTYAPRTLHQLSGGQWRRLSLALSLAFSECSLERTGTTCNLLVLDEVMQHLDSEGCMRVGRLLEELISRQLTCFTTVLVILQTSVGEELGDAFDEVDVIVKRRDCSVVQSISGKLY